jgi:hypothetical protein
MNTVVMSDMTLPTRPEGVTREWLEQALNFRFPGVKLKAAKIEDVICGTSTKIRVRLDYAGKDYGLPPTMIVKGGLEDHSERMRALYLKEMRFYRDLQPFVPIPSPRCFYAGADPDPAAYQAIIIMEDMRQPGVVFCHAQRPQSFDQVARRLDAMARYHAVMWNHPGFAPGGQFDWIIRNLENTDTLGYIDYYMEADRWRHYVESPRGAALSVRLHDGERLSAALKALGRFHNGFPQTLVEGDTHLGNLYINADGSPGFFDMMVNQAPWFHDVTYHIICALDIPDRRDWEKPLLMHYLNRLAAHGVAEVPSFEEAFECYRRDAVWGLFVFIINETHFQTESINTAYAARFGDAVLAHDSMRLLLS